MCKMKNILNGINFRLDTAEEKISELEDLVMGTMQGITQQEKNIYIYIFKGRASVNYGTSSSIRYAYLYSLRERSERWDWQIFEERMAEILPLLEEKLWHQVDPGLTLTIPLTICVPGHIAYLLWAWLVNSGLTKKPTFSQSYCEAHGKCCRKHLAECLLWISSYFH